jgi:predicted transcriptional regulator
MKLYELSAEFEQALSECIDRETGEITDIERLNQLNIAIEDKARDVALYILNLKAEEIVIAEALKKFLAKKKAISKKIEWWEHYLKEHTNGKEFTFPEVKISYLRSEETIITDKEAFNKYWQRHKALGTIDVKPDKKAIKEAIANGLKVKGVEIVEKKNIQIK